MSTVTLTPYARRHRRAVGDLLLRSEYVHTHLDWHDVDRWLAEAHAFVRLGWQGERLAGAISASMPLNRACWLRLVALDRRLAPRETLDVLWSAAARELNHMGARHIALLISRDWLVPHIEALDFRAYDEVVTLARNDPAIPDAPSRAVVLRPARQNDLDAMLHVDNAAFRPPWQLARGDLRQAQRISASCTVAAIDARMVGYQLSTHYHDHAHLARLAVHPEAQGSGVGSALLAHVIRHFARRGIYTITVNTQASNSRSLQVYQRFGFQRNGYDLPVHIASLAE